MRKRFDKRTNGCNLEDDHGKVEEKMADVGTLVRHLSLLPMESSPRELVIGRQAAA